MFKNKSFMLKKIQAWAILIITITISILIVIYLKRDFDNIHNLIIYLGPIAPLVSILFFGLLSITPIPSDPLALINGAVFGPFYGSLISLAGNNFAAFIEYYLGTNINTLANFDQQKKHLPFNLGKLPANSFYFLFFGRFIPGFGGKLISLMAGLYHVPLWRFTWTTTIANILGSALYALGGNALLNLI
jgi:uncharacterized membrane protein YdjX (TVP38/TMEM64 family)